VRKITGAIQPNIPQIRDSKAASGKKTKNPDEDFNSILELSTAAAESCGKEETEIEVGSGEKAGAEDKDGKGETGEKKEEGSTIQVIPTELMNLKNPASNPASEPSTEQKASITQKAAQPDSNRMPEAVDEVELKQDSKDEAIVFKDLMAAADVQAEGATVTETSEPAEDISQKVEKVQKQNSGESVPKPESPVGNPPGAVEDSASKIKTGDFRVGPNEPAAAAATPADRNIQTASAEIIHKMETLSEGESIAVKVKLHPEGLGEMEITMSMEKGKLSGTILVENKEIRQIFTDRIHELSQTLKDSNISVAKFDVGIGAGQDQSQSQERQQGQRHERYQNRTMRFMEEVAQYDEWKMSGQKELRGIDMLA
jgi:hypothetical protein